MTRKSFQACAYCECASPYLFSYASRDYYRCRFCDLIFHPRSKDGDATQIHYYRDDYFKMSSDDQLDNKRLLLYECVIQRIEKERKPGELLDVGCGRGVFLRIARRRGWSVTGIDPSVDSIREAQKSLDGRVFCATLDTMGVQHAYDVITLINVLDHMLDIRREIACAASFLRDGGLLYLRFPNGLFHASLLRLAGMTRLVTNIKSFVILHQYAVTPKFTMRLLKDGGFSKIYIHNSPLAGSSIYRASHIWRPLGDLLNRSVYLCARTLALLSGSQFIIGPSLEVTAVKSVSQLQ